MGAKFYNLNICQGDIDALRALMPGLSFHQVCPRWVTAVSEGFSWGGVQPVAKELSGLANAAVLSTEYFDDDYVEFAVYENGKLLTRHVPAEYEGLPRKKGSSKAFFTAFHMDLMDQKAFAKALAVEDCAESAALMESFLGCPILGVGPDNPPADPPSRAEADRLRGRKGELTAKVFPNPARVDAPPYVFTPEEPDQPVGGQTICCFTDRPEKIIKKLKGYSDSISRDKDESVKSAKMALELAQAMLEKGGNPFGGEMPTFADVEGLRAQLAALEKKDPFTDDSGRREEIRALLLPGRVCIQGIGFGCADACAPDHSRIFRSLVLLTSLGYGRGCAELNLAMAYGGKLLCHGIRGMEPRRYHNKVIENLTLESPWLTLPEGALTDAFERPGLGEAISALERLLRVRFTAIPPDRRPPVEEYGCLRVYRGDAL